MSEITPHDNMRGDCEGSMWSVNDNYGQGIANKYARIGPQLARDGVSRATIFPFLLYLVHPTAMESDGADKCVFAYNRIWDTWQATGVNAHEYQSITSFWNHHNLAVRIGNKIDTSNRRQGFCSLKFGDIRNGPDGVYSISGAVIEFNTIAESDVADSNAEKSIMSAVAKGVKPAATCDYIFRFNVIDADDTSERIFSHSGPNDETITAEIDSNVYGMDGTALSNAYTHYNGTTTYTRSWAQFSAGSWVDYNGDTQDANSAFSDPLLDANYAPGAGSPALTLAAGAVNLVSGQLEDGEDDAGWANAA